MMKKLRFLVSLHTRENKANPQKMQHANWGAMWKSSLPITTR